MHFSLCAAVIFLASASWVIQVVFYTCVCSRVLFVNLLVYKVVERFATFCGIWGFIKVFTTASSLSQPASDHSSAPNAVSWHPFWCLSSTSGSSTWSLPFGFSQHICSSYMHVTCPVHFTILHLITPVFVDQYKSWSSSLYRLPLSFPLSYVQISSSPPSCSNTLQAMYFL